MEIHLFIELTCMSDEKLLSGDFTILMYIQ